ncbi:MAG: hypothetical protein M3478_13935, partial [Planctomycetota bacterium]|nr:hypothetical protein [Planctomycetota bacterium]
MGWIIGIIVTPFVLFGLFAAWVFIDETEHPYRFTIRSARRALSFDGRSALSVIASTLGLPLSDLHVHTCGYCKGLYKTGRERPHVTVDVGTSGPIFHFLYERRTRQLIPSSRSTVDTFPSMVPPSADMVAMRSWIGGDTMMLPRAWREEQPGEDDLIDRRLKE